MSDIKVGDKVYNRHRQDCDINYVRSHVGIVDHIDGGTYWVDCGNEHLNLMSSLDIGKCEEGKTYK